MMVLPSTLTANTYVPRTMSLHGLVVKVLAIVVVWMTNEAIIRGGEILTTSPPIVAQTTLSGFLIHVKMVDASMSPSLFMHVNSNWRGHIISASRAIGKRITRVPFL